jgi:transglutaminase-like putative cysteine protease
MKAVIQGLLLALLVVHYSYAQKAPAKFGNVPIEDLKMTTYAPDSSAAAVVLVDYGESYLKYDQEKGFVLVFERLQRIKILKADGVNFASGKIMTYHNASAEEKVTGLKAITYNLENGRMVETKMKNESVFKEVFDKNRNVINFALPDVKVGSVVDITYTLSSEFLANFQDWEFQSVIPVAWSEYKVRFPEYFYFEKYTQGYVPFQINEHTTGSGQIVLRYKERSGDKVSKTEYHEEKINFMENRYRWVAKDVPAFREEPFMASTKDYISKINFELATVKYPNEVPKNYMGTWPDINKLYYESDDFGGEVNGNKFLKKIVDEITIGMTTSEQKVDAIINYLKSHVEWNGSSRSYSASKLKKVLEEEKKGNCAEINLLLASMLEKAGIVSHPVLISTRDHGLLRDATPNSTQFNYVLCHAMVDGKDILLDATEPLLPNNAIPERCLNGKGMIVAKEGPRWIPLVSPVKTKTIATASLKLLPDGQVAGDLVVERTGYEALRQRKKYILKGESDYLKDFLIAKEWTVSKSNFENVKETKGIFKEKHALEISNHATVAGDILYVNPFVLMQKATNPFKMEKREYPVDFGFSNDEVYMVSLEIPDGYVVDELPKSKIFMLPENASKYLYNCKVNGNTIHLTSSFIINKSLFSQVEYPDVREFFNQVVAKQAEQIVLKKKLN